MKFTLTQPDDWHLHLRDGAALAAVAPYTARQFHRAVIMPNLAPPVVTVAQAHAYRERILACLPANSDFTPLMTLYLTEDARPQEIELAAASAHVHAVKLYPAGATTHSASGVKDIDRVLPVLEKMEQTGLPLLVHGEVTDPRVDVFDREAVFIEQVLDPVCKKFPALKIVLEHVTTKEGAQWVAAQGPHIGATLTPQHLLLNRNALFQGGIRPHYYCLPVLKREEHRLALLAAATSGNPKFFLGTDSAPHARNKKEAACGCAGIFSAHAAIELYAEIFEAAGVLDKLEAFAAFNGADFYGLPRNTKTITLHKKSWQVAANLPFDQDVLVPFRAGETVSWTLE